MRLREMLRRSFARSDMETAWITSAALLLAVFVPGMFLYAYAAEESLEQFDRWFEYTLSVVGATRGHQNSSGQGTQAHVSR